MDIGAMKKDLRAALDALPKGMVNPTAVAVWLQKNRASLETVIPEILERMKPHVMAGMFESATGALDTEELEAACVETLLSFGVDVGTNA